MGQTVNLLFRLRRFESSCPHSNDDGCALLKNQAKVAQLVELQPSKLEVAGSRPVFRSNSGEVKLMNNRINGQKIIKACICGFKAFVSPQKRGTFRIYKNEVL